MRDEIFKDIYITISQRSSDERADILPAATAVLAIKILRRARSVVARLRL